jgi:hypothetical protein
MLRPYHCFTLTIFTVNRIHSVESLAYDVYTYSKKGPLFKVVNKTTKKAHTPLATSVTLVTWVQVPIPHKRSESGLSSHLVFIIAEIPFPYWSGNHDTVQIAENNNTLHTYMRSMRKYIKSFYEIILVAYFRKYS